MENYKRALGKVGTWDIDAEAFFKHVGMKMLIIPCRQTARGGTAAWIEQTSFFLHTFF